MTSNEGQPEPTLPETPQKLVSNGSEELIFINH